MSIPQSPRGPGPVLSELLLIPRTSLISLSSVLNYSLVLLFSRGGPCWRSTQEWSCAVGYFSPFAAAAQERGGRRERRVTWLKWTVKVNIRQQKKNNVSPRDGCPRLWHILYIWSKITLKSTLLCLGSSTLIKALCNYFGQEGDLRLATQTALESLKRTDFYKVLSQT